MRKEIKMAAVVCDCCQTTFENDYGIVCYLDDNEQADLIWAEAESVNWLHLGGCDYCPNCYEFDNKGHIITKDGRKFDEYTEKEIN